MSSSDESKKRRRDSSDENKEKKKVKLTETETESNKEKGESSSTKKKETQLSPESKKHIEDMDLKPKKPKSGEKRPGSGPITAKLDMLTGSAGVPQGMQNQSYVDPRVDQPLRTMAEQHLQELELQHIKLGPFISKGSYGTVVRGVFMDVKEVAVKICDLGDNPDVTYGLEIARELKHDNIIGIIHILEKFDVIFIVMPFAETDLLRFVINGGAISQFDAKIMCRQVLTALQYMHNKSYAHRDIKMENILYFTAQNKYKICDLDRAVRAVDQNGIPINRSNFGTPEYLPPEILLNQNWIDLRKHDIWSFGILTFACVTYTYAFGTIVPHHPDLNQKILVMQSHVVRYPAGCDTSAEFEQFIRQVLVYDHNQRPTADVLLQNPWFTTNRPQTSNRFRVTGIHAIPAP